MALEQASTNCRYQEKKPCGVFVSGSVPLNLAEPGRDLTVQAIRGKDDVKRFLETLGFVEGARVSVVSELGGNVIVNVKDTRVAISRVMASRIYTTQPA